MSDQTNTYFSFIEDNIINKSILGFERVVNEPLSTATDMAMYGVAAHCFCRLGER